MASRQQSQTTNDPKQPVDDRERPPLPSGHPTAWQILTKGTLLEGTVYPLPVFL